MGYTLAKIVKYHIFRNRLVFYTALVCLVFDIIKSFLDTHNASDFSLLVVYRTIRRSKVPRDSPPSMGQHIFLSTSAIAIDLFIKCASALLLCRSFQNFFNIIYARFLSIRWTNWRRSVNGNIFDIISRKSTALSEIVDNISFRIVNSVVYLLLVVHGVSKSITAKVGFILFVAVVFYLGLCLFIERCKGRLSMLKNQKEDILYEKSVDIFANHDMIHISNMLDTEMAQYAKHLEEYILYMRLDWLANCLLDAIKVVYVSVVRILLLMYSVGFYNGSTQEINFMLGIVKRIFSRTGDLSKCLGQVAYLLSQAQEDRFEKLELEDLAAPRLTKVGIERELAIDGLEFQHDGKFLYRNVKLSIPQGAKIAIVGRNGSGKTTILKQMIRLYDSKHCIRIDGVDTDIITPDSYAKLVTYVPQESLLFDTTILENIKCYNPAVTDKDVFVCCEKAGLTKYFKDAKYDFVLTNGGVNIPDVQRQAIALARALVKDTPILLIDELIFGPAIFRNLFSEYPEKTIVAITHDMSTLEFYDQIIFYKQGTYVMLGPLDQALESDKAFAEYYKQNI